MTQGQHRATARVLDILESLSGSEEGLTLTELSQALDAPKSSLFPIVHTLEERRYLPAGRWGPGRYTMGPRALVLGAAFSADRGLAPITQVMKEVLPNARRHARWAFWTKTGCCMWRGRILPSHPADFLGGDPPAGQRHCRR